MKMTGNTILITGGATGIGYSLAIIFLRLGNTVIICGRREDRLAGAAGELPGLHTFRCDVANPEDRAKLFAHISERFPGTNILINNAGIQRDIDLTKEAEELYDCDEIRVNLEAPIALSAIFTKFLSGKENAAIVNISSGLAFMPERTSGIPLYTASKAGLHAFSVAQRLQLAPLGIRVIELIPPIIESELNLEGRRRRNALKSPHMMSPDEFAEAALAEMEQDITEIKIRKK
jgi:uncharacterized oxidoreductase